MSTISLRISSMIKCYRNYTTAHFDVIGTQLARRTASLRSAASCHSQIYAFITHAIFDVQLWWMRTRHYRRTVCFTVEMLTLKTPESRRHAHNDGIGIHHHKSEQSHNLINAVKHLSMTPEDYRITLKPVQTAQCCNVFFTRLLMAAVQDLVHLQVAAAAAAAVANFEH